MMDSVKNPWEVILTPCTSYSLSELTSEKIEALDQIVNGYPPISSLPHLVPILLRNEHQLVKDEVSQAIRILMERMLKEHSYVISQSFAEVFHYINLSVDHIPLLSTYKYSSVLLGIATLHMNGYVREAALDQLGSLNEEWSLCLPFLLARLNDHIEIIREKSKGYLERILPECSLKDILCNSDAFIHYDKAWHTKDLNLQQKAFDCIRKTPAETLISSLSQWPSRAQIFILKSLLEEIEGRKDLLENVLAHADPSVKQWFVNATFGWEFPTPLIKQMLKNPYSAIRQAALRKIKPESVEAFRKETDVLIYDRSRRVRESARYLWRLKGIDDLRDSYCQLLENLENPPVGLMVGLMEVAESQDLDRIESYLSHLNKYVRSAALSSMHRIKGIEAMELVLEGLLDKSGTVRKTAANILKNSPSVYDERVRLYLSQGPEYAKRTCFGILVSRKNSYSLQDILTVLGGGEDSALVNQAWGAFSNWCQYVLPSLYYFPDKAFHEGLLQSMDKVEKVHKEIPIDLLDCWKNAKSAIRTIGS